MKDKPQSRKGSKIRLGHSYQTPLPRLYNAEKRKFFFIKIKKNLGEFNKRVQRYVHEEMLRVFIEIEQAVQVEKWLRDTVTLFAGKVISLSQDATVLLIINQ